MYRTKIVNILENAVKKTFEDKNVNLDSFFPVTLEICLNEEYGDYSSPIALQISSLLESESYELAQAIVNSIEHLPVFCQSIKASSSGFINITLSKDSVYYGLMSVLHRGEDMSPPNLGKGKKIELVLPNLQISFSFNTDYIRCLLLFDFFKRILTHVGYKVGADYIIRDSGEMLWIFSVVAEHHYREFFGDFSLFAMNTIGSKNAVAITREIIDKVGCELLPITKPQRIGAIKDEIPNILLKKAKEITTALGLNYIHFQPASKLSYYSAILKELEKKLKNDDFLYEENVPHFKQWICGRVDKFIKSSANDVININNIKEKISEKYVYWNSRLSSDGSTRRDAESFEHLIYNKEKQTWIKSVNLGDVEDRIFYLPEDEPSDCLLNVAMILNAFKKGASKIIFPFSSGISIDMYNQVSLIPEYMGINRSSLEMIPINSVVIDDGNTEHDYAGDALSISSIINKIGRNALVYSFFSKSPHQPLEINLNLFSKEDSSNPLFVLDLAFSRIKSVLKTSSLKEYPSSVDGVAKMVDIKSFNEFAQDIDRALVKQIISYPSVICDSAYNYDPSMLLSFTLNIASDFNDYYENVKIFSGDKMGVVVKIAIVQAVRIVLTSAMSILGLKL